jgi:hypothetical protein
MPEDRGSRVFLAMNPERLAGHGALAGTVRERTAGTRAPGIT